MANQTTHFNISTDREISSGKDDRLGRKGFADSLANGIRRWKNKDSLVVGLFGSWGSGKTSIKNLILETLREKGDCPEIVEFNPWQLADRDQLNSAFFQEIGIALGRPDSSHEHKRTSSKFILYGAYLKTGAYLFQGTRRFTILLIRLILGAAIVLGFSIDFVSTEYNAPWIKWVVGIGLLLIIFSENLSGWLSGLFEHLAAIQAAKTQSQEKSLEERKSEISALLEKIKNPLLIVIDDVDRLTNDEISHLFQLIKANADFPNLIYLILCDREVVEQSLDKLTPGRGKEFLKKIIQVQFNIPQIKREKLDKFIFDGLDEVIRDSRVSKVYSGYFDDHRWETIFTDGMKPYFQSIRDVNWYMNSLSFIFSQFLQENTFEVNAVDLIALEAIRVFEGEVYRKLYGAKLLLTSPYFAKYNEEPAELLKKDIFDSAYNKLQVQTLLKSLFPLVKWESNPLMDSHEDENELLRTLRVGHPDNFGRYFNFTIPEDEISQVDVELLINHSRNKESLLNDFKAYKKRGLLEELLCRLKVNLERVDFSDSIIVISALFDVGDEFKNEERTSTSQFNRYSFSIVSHLLTREADLNSRHNLLKVSIENSRAFSMPTYHVTSNVDAWDKSKDQSEFPENYDQKLEELKEICLRRIQEASLDGRLRVHPDRVGVLQIWAGWASTEAVAQWVRQEIQDRAGLFSFVGTFRDKFSNGLKTTEYIVHKRLKEFIPIHEFERKLEDIPPKELSEAEREIINMFYQGKEEG